MKRNTAFTAKSIGSAILVLAISSPVWAQKTPTNEELWKVIQSQQAEIEALKSEQKTTKAKVEKADAKVTATADAIETMSLGGSSSNKTSIGGYGELHYNNLDNNLSGGDNVDEIDLHRFVLFVNHEFNDNVRLFTEIEIEHALAGDGKPGEVELEQAYIEFDVAKGHRAKAGLFLVPVGILNETHEPNTFYGVERNNVEKNIIPTTWWEAGGAVNGEFAPGLSYDFALHSGLDLDAGSGDYKIRDGRQKVAEANADNLAYSGRIKYTGIPGLELAATLQIQTDLFQGESIPGASDIGATLMEVHAVFQSGPLTLRALAATWDIDNDIETVQAGADKQRGWYVEPGYRIFDNLGVFARFSAWDNQAGDSSDSEYKQTDIGLNYWMTEQVVFKVDYQIQDAPSGSNEYDGFNLGVGWAF